VRFVAETQAEASRAKTMSGGRGRGKWKSGKLCSRGYLCYFKQIPGDTLPTFKLCDERGAQGRKTTG